MPHTRHHLNRRASLFLGAALVGLTVTGWTHVALARQNPPPAPKKAPPTISPANNTDTDKKWADVSGQDWVHNDATGDGACHDFHYVEHDTTMTCAQLHYNDHKKVMVMEGDIVMEDPDHRITGEKANVDYGNKKLAIITDNVVLTLKSESKEHAGDAGKGAPSPAASKGNVGVAPIDPPDKATAAPASDNSKQEENVGKARQRGGTATCDRLDDYYKKKFAILRGHLVFKQKFTDDDGKEVERTVTAEHGEYDGKTEILVLFAPVDVHETTGREMHFDGNVTLHTKEGGEALQSQSKFKGKLPLPDDDTDTDSGTPSTTAPSTTPTKPPAKSDTH